MNKNDKVILVDDRWTPGIEHLYRALPVKDTVYCIREVQPGVCVDTLLMDCHQKPEPSLLLVGITNEVDKSGYERGFAARRFRKLDEASRVNEEFAKATR